MITFWEEIKALVEHKVVFLDKERTKYVKINEKEKKEKETHDKMCGIER